MREMRIDKWCDLCHVDDKGARVEAVQTFMVDIMDLGARPLGSSGRRPEPRVIEVCDTHADTISFMQRRASVGVTLERFRAMTGQVAPTDPEPTQAAVTATGAKQAKRKRKPCPVCGKPLVSSSIGTHLIEVHGARPPRQPKSCPDCKRKAKSDASMILHRTRAHDYDHHGELATSVRSQPALTDPD